MLLEKVYTETIDVRDPEGYCARPEAYITTYLHRRFVGRCRKGAFIVAILEIRRRSDCRMKTTDLTAEAYVEVEFLAQVSIIGQWDVVTGVKIANRGQLIVGRSETEGVAVVSLLPTPEAETVRVEQIVAVRALRVQYSPDQAQATVVGPLLTCDKAAPSYRVTASLSAEDVKSLAPLVAQAKALLEARAKLMETRREDLMFFETLLYSYVRGGSDAAQKVETPDAHAWEGPPAASLPAGAKSVNLLTLLAGGDVSDAQGVWCRDLSLYRSSPLAARAAAGGSLPAGWGAPVSATPRTAFGSMLQTVCVFLKAVNEMVETYNTAELMDAHKNIWLVMRGSQLPRP